MRLLRQVPDGEAGRGEGLADERGLEARHELQQRALAGAVVAQDADLGAGQEREPDVAEDGVVGGIDLPEPLHREDELWRHAWTLPALPSRAPVEAWARRGR